MIWQRKWEKGKNEHKISMSFDPSRRVGSSSAEDATGYLWTHKGKHTKKSKQQTKAPQLCGGRKQKGGRTHTFTSNMHAYAFSLIFLSVLSLPVLFWTYKPKNVCILLLLFWLLSLHILFWSFCLLLSKRKRKGEGDRTTYLYIIIQIPKHVPHHTYSYIWSYCQYDMNEKVCNVDMDFRNLRKRPRRPKRETRFLTRHINENVWR